YHSASVLHTYVFFFTNSPILFTAPSPTEIYTLSLHDALPISPARDAQPGLSRVGSTSTANRAGGHRPWYSFGTSAGYTDAPRFEIGRAHAELQSREKLVCRLLLEKKNNRSASG